jgi:hypothetical protein
MSDIKNAIDRLVDKRSEYQQAHQYYEGSQKELFPNQKWASLLKSTTAYRFNFTKAVVDSVLNRLEIASVLGTTEQANSIINKVWESNDLVLDADEIHRRALVYGDAYAIVWTDESGEVQINYNSPLTTVVVYDTENPRLKRFAAKMWQHTDPYDGSNEKIVRLNMYYSNRIEKYEAFGDVETIISPTAFRLIETIENPWNEVPVFHFRTAKQYGRPEHFDAFGPQDAINKLLITHMNTVDYQGAPQRYALATGGNDAEFEDFDEIDNSENFGALKNGPGELWYLKGISKVGEFSPADHKVFTEPIREYVRAMASLTSTPLHYFEKGASLASGEALRTSEAPLIKKVQDRQISFGSTWRDLFRFLLKIENLEGQIMSGQLDVQIKWVQPESLDTLDSWEVAVKKRVVGVSLKQVLIEMGYDSEIADVIVSQADEGLMSQGMNSSNVIAEQSGQRID